MKILRSTFFVLIFWTPIFTAHSQTYSFVKSYDDAKKFYFYAELEEHKRHAVIKMIKFSDTFEQAKEIYGVTKRREDEKQRHQATNNMIKLANNFEQLVELYQFVKDGEDEKQYYRVIRKMVKSFETFEDMQQVFYFNECLSDTLQCDYTRECVMTLRKMLKLATTIDEAKTVQLYAGDRKEGLWAIKKMLQLNATRASF